MSEFYNKYRPKNFKQVVGQEKAIGMLESLSEIPHSICLHGPTGVGKTTIARILRELLDCSELDFREYNAASARGVDTIREIESKLSLAPMSGRHRIFYLDEAHRLTHDAQSALLKVLEDTKPHIYFILATTDPNKLLPTVRTRCLSVALNPAAPSAVKKVLKRICKAEKLEISDQVLDKIAEEADGSFRRGVMTLESVAGLDDEESMLQAIEEVGTQKQAFDLVRYLLNGRGTGIKGWEDIADILRHLPDDEIERFRRQVLGYANAFMIGPKDLNKPTPKKPNQQAYKVITAFADNFFDSGKAGLTAAICEVLFAD